ncbi:hypothetical protein L6164_002382 [Bauhinia variegata]|uniref:Uncharacterized protein n=1 Tax=Bauhinia variegata TaxID=167791 RepID=A0ACB9Q0Q6_BAUVA|nr:hypothetical protein L6164_002382 [Bauhinia variegata]
MEPRVSDFGVAIHIAQSSSPMHTLRSSYIAGTVGYMAPENAYTIVQSGKSDVYSYGVVLLELITRKMVLDPSFNDQTTLIGWVRSVWEETPHIEKIVDPSLVMKANLQDMKPRSPNLISFEIKRTCLSVIESKYAAFFMELEVINHARLLVFKKPPFSFSYGELQAAGAAVPL